MSSSGRSEKGRRKIHRFVNYSQVAIVQSLSYSNTKLYNWTSDKSKKNFLHRNTHTHTQTTNSSECNNYIPDGTGPIHFNTT